jgi:uncharacterized membrane protein YfcA
LTPLDWALVTVVMLVGAGIQGGVGFGMNLIAAPILLLIDPRLVPGPAVLAAALITLLTAIRDHRGLSLGDVKWAFVGRIPGTAAAIVVLLAVTGTALSLTLAAIVLVAVAMSASGVNFRIRPSSLAAAGAASGFMGTISSIGGPPMAVLYAGEEGVKLRGTLAGFFFLGTFVSIAALLIAGKFGTTEMRLAAGLVPGIALGFAFSGRLATRLDAGHTRTAVLAVASLAAVSVIVTEVV